MHMHRQSTQTVRTNLSFTFQKIKNKRTNLSARTAYLNLSPFPHCFILPFHTVLAVSMFLISI